MVGPNIYHTFADDVPSKEGLQYTKATELLVDTSTKTEKCVDNYQQSNKPESVYSNREADASSTKSVFEGFNTNMNDPVSQTELADKLRIAELESGIRLDEKLSGIKEGQRQLENKIQESQNFIQSAIQDIKLQNKGIETSQDWIKWLLVAVASGMVLSIYQNAQQHEASPIQIIGVPAQQVQTIPFKPQATQSKK